MLKEFAVEPKLLDSWTVCKEFYEKFSYSQGRVISRYPKKWDELVAKAVKSNDSCRPNDKLRIFERLNMIKKEALYIRHHEFDKDMIWIDNTIIEHQKRPFCAIISNENPHEVNTIICYRDLDEIEEPRWKRLMQCLIERKAEKIAACAKPLLYNAKELLFIEPHFRPTDRFLDPFKSFFEIIHSRPAGIPIERIELHTGNKATNTLYNFEIQCNKKLAAIIPLDMKMKIIRWDQADLHDRYIFNEYHGLEYSFGLDEASHPALSTTKVTNLQDNVYRTLWDQFQLSTSPFKLIDDRLSIQGTA